jgi:hypothetical protein
MPAEIIAFSSGLPYRGWSRNSENVCLASSRGEENREGVSKNRDGPASHGRDEPADACQDPRIAGRTVGGEVLPNVLPFPRKSSPKQDEPRAIRMRYVIELEGTT